MSNTDIFYSFLQQIAARNIILKEEESLKHPSMNHPSMYKDAKEPMGVDKLTESQKTVCVGWYSFITLSKLFLQVITEILLKGLESRLSS